MSNLQPIHQAAKAQYGSLVETYDYDGVPLELFVDMDGELQTICIGGHDVSMFLDRAVWDEMARRVEHKADDYRAEARMQFRIEQAESRRPF